METWTYSAANGEQNNLEYYLSLLAPFKVLDRLAALRKPCAIVADDAVLDAVRRLQTREGARLISSRLLTNSGFPTPLAGPYFVATIGDEIAMKRQLRQILKIKGIFPEIYGVVNDICPMMVSEQDVIGRGSLDEGVEDLSKGKNFVILCTPRSGSQFLARELETRGIGAPREHIRPAVIDLLRVRGDARVGGMDFTYFLPTLARVARKNDVFGTKIISHFLRDLKRLLTPAEWALLEQFAGGAFKIYLLRRNKLMQALSRDRAKSTQHYHLFSEGRREEYADKSQAWTYDFARISEEIVRLGNEEQQLFDIMSAWPKGAGYLVVDYEQMDADAIASTVAQGLQVTLAADIERKDTHILRDDKTREFAERFVADYRAAYRADDSSTHLPHSFFLDADGTLSFVTAPDALSVDL
ncbi:Stf0 family sulfotransferase [Acuticoccus mangrovi]|uniref:Sulphotransferase Stf0 domain-containing protein n=1 Tax=Acuticoccus mangrovi TaxID=2796142 RepID=A0A934ILL4_9HYPH|nr:Stf0 family sulfotransferase [Acuticoccus mangrovi]MBJ3774890.1 hypothetical protein [Acuticoccus mangrovi]